MHVKNIIYPSQLGRSSDYHKRINPLQTQMEWLYSFALPEFLVGVCT